MNFEVCVVFSTSDGLPTMLCDLFRVAEVKRCLMAWGVYKNAEAMLGGMKVSRRKKIILEEDDV